MSKVTAEQSNTAANDVAVEKPVRRSFYRNIFVAANGSTVNDEQVAQMITATEQKERRKQMKSHGLKEVSVFDAEGYQAARKAYFEGNKAKAKEDRENLIKEAFTEAGINPTDMPRAARALKTMLPMFDDVQSKKTTAAFKSILKTIVSSVPSEDKNVAGGTDKAPKEHQAA